ncbi:hypothetical protein IW261DRAFT_1463109 [Armillaria novae-zelandiae]|uniref:Uncharacterized protein n=1 Tax=Armillaria novae-zelandiae TaxID=153914 RepID=A0AA39UL90_9AGAR|nr:hypothetical protein IW261DRAFT_1463109 [Armillaria novae-zelandiae]
MLQLLMKPGEQLSRILSVLALCSGPSGVSPAIFLQSATSCSVHKVIQEALSTEGSTGSACKVGWNHGLSTRVYAL